MLLALDTATSLAGIALLDGDSLVRGSYRWQTGRNHTVELMPNIIRLLSEAGLRSSEASGADSPHSTTGSAGRGHAASASEPPKNIGEERSLSWSTRGLMPADALEAVAVAIGPGSYTGLRIGLSVAKGFCLAYGAALVAVPTLDISAMACPPRDGVLCALLQAGRGRLAAGFYRAASGRWQSFGGLFFGRAAELAEACAGQTTCFVGELDDATVAVLRERLAGLAEFAPAGERARDPRVLALLGRERLRLGQLENLETLAPAYGQ